MTIHYDGKKISIKEGQSVLEALLDEGHDIPNSCRAGVCQSCLMQAVEGEVPSTAQEGLKDTLKAQGYFLSCACKPESPISIILPDKGNIRTAAKVLSSEILTPYVLRLRLEPEGDFHYRPGQYITVWSPDNAGRSYSLASVPAIDSYLELHIRLIVGGAVSTWLHEQVKPGDTLELQGPAGDCFYVPGEPEQKLLLAGTGTGLAPLFGIVRDALYQQHEGEIHLVHGAVEGSGLYLNETLQRMAGEHENFHYHASTLNRENAPENISEQSVEELVASIAEKPREWKYYFCGAPDLVNGLKKKMFLAGASMKDIYSDPFLI